MQKFFLPILLLSILTGTEATAQQDFPDLARYQADNEARMGRDNDVVLIGNSITDSWYARDTAFFDRHGLIGRGISGQTSMQLLLRFRADVVDLHPNTVVIHIGTNDVAENTGPYYEDLTVDNITSMIDIAEQNDIDIVLASVLPATGFNWRPEVGDRSAEIVALNARLQQLAEERGVHYLDYHSRLKNAANGMDADVAPDGVHPTPKGYKMMGGLLLEALD